jgi:hypothetical protein
MNQVVIWSHQNVRLESNSYSIKVIEYSIAESEMGFLRQICSEELSILTVVGSETLDLSARAIQPDP